MTPQAHAPQQRVIRSPDRPTVRVDLGRRGKWDVVVSGEARPIRCDTFEDASRAAHRIADGEQSCDLIVRDAYHRVVRRGYRPRPAP